MTIKKIFFCLFICPLVSLNTLAQVDYTKTIKQPKVTLKPTYSSHRSTVLPYFVQLNYDKDVKKSTKDTGTISGVYVSSGDLSYLLEADFAKTNISYKDKTTTKYSQTNSSLFYSHYRPKFMAKIGVHTINTNDTSLGNGSIYALIINGYHWKKYDKHTYGIELFASEYEKKVSLMQYSPHYIHSQAIDINTRNNIELKVNYITTNDYITTSANVKSWTSFEFANTLYYKKWALLLKAYGGEMKTGVKDSGSTVFNNKDLLKTGYTTKINYFMSPSSNISIGYSSNSYREDGAEQDGINTAILVTLSHTF